MATEGKMTRAQREKAWLEERTKHITSTELAPIMGIPGAFGSPLEVWQGKKGLLEKKSSAQMRAGNRLQPIILEWYADEVLAGPIAKADPYELLVCAEHPVLAASLDARHLGDAVQGALGIPVDAKNVRARNPEEWGEDGSADVPAKYVVQLHAQMLCTGTEEARLAALFAGHDFGWFRVLRDPEIIAGCIEAAEEFWTKYVLGDIPPPVDASEAWSKWLASRRKKLQVEYAPASVGDRLGLELRLAYRELAKAEERKELLANHMKEAMGENEVATGSFGRISFAWSRDGEKTDLDGYTTVLEGRVLELDPAARPFLEKARKQFTEKKPGTRTFRPTFKEE